jgi:hypothetical protein
LRTRENWYLLDVIDEKIEFRCDKMVTSGSESAQKSKLMKIAALPSAQGGLFLNSKTIAHMILLTGRVVDIDVCGQIMMKISVR